MKKLIPIAVVAFMSIPALAFAQGPQRGQVPSIDEVFDKMDANEDDKLSLEEVKGPIKKDFDKIDLNQDGFITREELEKAPKPTGDRPKRNG